MLKYIEHGDIFDSKCEALINPVNCVGVMGKGLAKQFRLRFPGMFQDYKNRCKRGLIKIEVVDLHHISHEPPLYIINFPTKQHWRDCSELFYIEKGLAALTLKVKQYKINSLAFPKIGCGLGGLDWNDVGPLIEYFANQNKELLMEIYL